MATNREPPHYDLATAPLDEGTVLLEASAGTGKTYTLTGLLLRLLLEGVVARLDQVLVVTFTVAAADELKTRLRAALARALAVCRGAPDSDPFFAGLNRFGAAGAATLRRALDGFDQAAIATIHGFCKRLLDAAAFESHEPFELDLLADELPLYREAAADALRRVRAADEPLLGALLHLKQPTPESLVAPYRLWQRHPDTRLEPEPDLPGQLRALATAVGEAAGHWQPELAEAIAALRWKSDGAPSRGDLRLYVASQVAQLHSQPELALRFLVTFALSSLGTRLRSGQLRNLQHPFFSACDRVAAAANTAAHHLRNALLRAMHGQLATCKAERAVRTYQDLLQRVHDAIVDPRRGPPLLAAVRAAFQVALIDEFQDTDALQYGIFRTCFENRPLFLVGDPKQSIYAFRGADLHTYLAARDHAVQQATLAVNFRSARLLVQAVGQLFRVDHAFVEPKIRLPEITAHAAAGALALAGDERAPLQWRLLPCNNSPSARNPIWSSEHARVAIAADIAGELQRLFAAGVRLDGRPLRNGDIAVLTRTNAEAMLIHDTLRAAGIAAVIGRAGDVFRSDELAELEIVLAALLQPNDLARARAALATRIFGHDAAALAALRQDGDALDAELARLQHWRQLWLQRGVFAALHHLMTTLGTSTRLLGQQGGERRLANLQQLAELLHEAEHEHRLSPESLLHWLRRERDQPDELDYERREMRLESDADAVQILTVHGSKGLQYEIVFCPFLWRGRTRTGPDLVAGGPGRWRLVPAELATAADAQAAESERLAEDIRLAYVALTRARRRCYVHFGPLGQQGGFDSSALAWLLQPQPPDQSRPEWQADWSDTFRTADTMALVRSVVGGSGGAMDVVEVQAVADDGGPPAPPPPRAAPAAPVDRAAPRPQRRPPPTRRALGMYSFSSLAAGAEPGGGGGAPAPATAAAPTQGMFAFARGAAAGRCLHAVLEHADLGEAAAAATGELVQRTLRDHGFLDRSAHPGDIDPVAVVWQNVRDLAASLVTPEGPTFAALTAGPVAREWQFTLPVRDAAPRRLADLFTAADCPIASGYGERLRRFDAQRLAGYLTGFVDLVAACDGRYWIVDWKSNHLGNTAGDYRGEALIAALHEHDYVLQYHLYALALHRHLGVRLRDYDYGRCFGGVAYVFLRGIAPGTTDGIVTARPPQALIAGLDRWADEPGGRR